ncbi:hypothetical protein KR032_009811 [Drosophila birchii]|nr:hypothetical protein KR032_009811 [Drosophila birchii]
MGNVMDRKVSCAEARVNGAATSPTSPSPLALKETEKLVAKSTEEDPTPQPQLAPNLTFHLYSYRQQMGCKKHQVMKWATSKLMLTEELLKLHRQTTSKPWTDFDLTDDDEEELEDVENRIPARDNNDNDDLLAEELCNLKNYRLTLRGTILEVAQEKMTKREKKKLKRLKRRTLISSKKPSNKDKHKLWQYPSLSMPLLDDEEEEEQQREQDAQPEVIVID